MKKLLMGSMLAMALVLAGLFPAQSHAVGNPAQTDVTGVITDGGVPVGGAEVKVKCGAFMETDPSTDAFGSYLVTFAYADCPPGSMVTVTAKKDDKSGTKTGTVVGITTKLNVGLVNVDIPEYGAIGAILAGSAGIGAIVFARRRFAQQGTMA